MKKSKTTDKKRTQMYADALNSMYCGMIKLTVDSLYQGPRHWMTHSCTTCGNTFESRGERILGGSGCPKCRSTPAHAQALAAHLMSLSTNKRFKLAVTPLKFTGKRSVAYQCLACSHVSYARPGKVLEGKHNCPSCFAIKAFGKNHKAYVARLDLVFEGRVKCKARYHQSNAIKHECDSTQPHSWDSRISDTLLGKGCPYCKLLAKVKQLKPFRYRNKAFVVSTLVEREAISVVCADVKDTSTVRTRFDHPIPALIGKHVPAYFLKGTNTLIDVFAASKYKKYKALIRRSYLKAKELGYGYTVVLIATKPDGEKQAILLKTSQWISQNKDTDVPDNWGINDYNIGSENRRMKIFTPKGA